jgi:CBS domain-containing protein
MRPILGGRERVAQPIILRHHALTRRVGRVVELMSILSLPAPRPHHVHVWRAAVKLKDSVELILRSKGTRVYSIGADATVYEALQLLAEKNIGALVVMDGAALAGMFSERDYARKVILIGRSSKEMRVREVMSSPVVTVAPTTPVDECMYLMTTHRFRHLPVAQAGSVVGVLSIGDLVNWIISAQDFAIHQLEDYIAGKYPG